MILIMASYNVAKGAHILPTLFVYNLFFWRRRKFCMKLITELLASYSVADEAHILQQFFSLVSKKILDGTHNRASSVIQCCWGSIHSSTFFSLVSEKILYETDNRASSVIQCCWGNTHSSTISFNGKWKKVLL